MFSFLIWLIIWFILINRLILILIKPYFSRVDGTNIKEIRKFLRKIDYKNQEKDYELNFQRGKLAFDMLSLLIILLLNSFLLKFRIFIFLSKIFMKYLWVSKRNWVYYNLLYPVKVVKEMLQNYKQYLLTLDMLSYLL